MFKILGKEWLNEYTRNQVHNNKDQLNNNNKNDQLFNNNNQLHNMPDWTKHLPTTGMQIIIFIFVIRNKLKLPFNRQESKFRVFLVTVIYR